MPLNAGGSRWPAAPAATLLSERTWCTMADVDAAGIIYFTSALRWAERLSTSWFRTLGHPYTRLFAEGIATPAVNAQADYRSHVTLDDEIRLDLWTSHIGTSSYTLTCEIFVADSDIAAVDTRITHVYTRYTRPQLDRTDVPTRPQPLPDWLREGLEVGLR